MTKPEAAAHTAEHVFMRALTKRVKVRPILVEQEGWTGKIVVEGDEPTWEAISDALLEANSVIMEGRRVIEREFGSLEEARAAFPDLRAYEERIRPPVRVVEVEGYDWAACAREHASNTSEAWGISVSDLRSLSKGRHEIRFGAGPAAAEVFSAAIRDVGLSSRALNAKLGSVAARVAELLSRLDELRSVQRSLARSLIRGPTTLRTASGAELRVLEVEGLDFKGLIDEAVEAASSSGSYLVVVLRGERAQVLLAAPRGSGLHAGKFLRELLEELGGRGGGGQEAATGSLDVSSVPAFLDALRSRL